MQRRTLKFGIIHQILGKKSFGYVYEQKRSLQTGILIEKLYHYSSH